MFNSTHTLVGLAIAKTAPEKWTSYATATAVIASNLPDIDSVAGFWGTAAYLDHHRGITHSLIGVPVLALLLSLGMYFLSGNFWKTYAVALIAMATHPALDYLNPYGLRPFLPLSDRWYYGDSVFIFDPYLDVLLLLGILAAWFRPNQKRLAAAAALAVAFVYIGVRIELHGKAMSEIQPLVARFPQIQSWAAMPTMWDPSMWIGMAASDSQTTRFDVDTAHRLKSEMDTMSLVNAPSSDVVSRAAATPSAEALLRFARFPVSHVQMVEEGYRVTLLDYRFLRMGRDNRTGSALAVEVRLDKSMRVTNESLSFVHPIELW